MRLISPQKDQNTIRSMFTNVREEFRKEISSSKLQNWLNNFSISIPNSNHYGSLIRILEDNEIKNSFIDEILKNNYYQTDYKNSLLTSINEVTSLKQQAEIN